MYNLDSYGECFCVTDQLYSAGHSTKKAGDARNTAIIIELLNKKEISWKALIRPKQTHSTNITVIRGIQKGIVEIPDTDGIITKEKEIVLTVLSGDCVTVMFADKQAGVIGAAHMGWKGTLNNMTSKMVRQMCEEGASVKNIQAHIASGIGSCCYSVQEERIDLFRSKYSHLQNQFIEKRNNIYFLNLPLLNKLQLQDCGIADEHITSLGLCTYSNPELFFSYRRDTKENFGEMVTFIAKK